MVVYLYTVVAFNFFRKFYNKSEDDDEPDMKCDDMMTVSTPAMATRPLEEEGQKKAASWSDGADVMVSSHCGSQRVPALLSLWDED